MITYHLHNPTMHLWKNVKFFVIISVATDSKSEKQTHAVLFIKIFVACFDEFSFI